MAIRFRAECVEVRERDGAQHFVATDSTVPDHLRHVWLMGIDRVPGLLAGAIGTLAYTSTAGRGRYVFERE